ncbi:hypothetical protein F6Y02_41540 (plasmid) [Bacillus megaterium]|nr:hypothetical protein [Priestia megaterium]
MPVTIENETELDTVVLKAKNYAMNLCNKLSPSLIPLLTQMYQWFYNGHWNLEPAWLGTAVKRLIAHVYKNQFDDVEQLSTSRSDVIQALYALALYENLCNFELISKLTKVKIDLTREWTYPNNDDTEFYLKETAYMYSDRGSSHRTLKQSIDMWVKKPGNLLESIDRILAGESPVNQPLFRNNFFRLLPSKKNFWLQFRSLIQLAVAVVNQLGNENLPVDSIVYLPGNKELNKIMKFDITADIYWKKKWYFETMRSVSVLDISSLIVYRPILSYSKNPNLNVTSLSIVADAINYFIESSIFKGYSGHATPFREFYQKVIATPFEDETQKFFREQGFITGSIPKPREERTSKCTLEIQDNGNIKKIEISHNDGEVFPGEVDVLAYHPTNKVFIIAECKTFSIPYSTNEMESLIKRFTNRSKGSYQRKLEKKVNWFKNAQFSMNEQSIPSNPSQEKEIEFKALFIVDRKIVNMDEFTKIPVYDIGYLKGNSKNLLFS